ncbi:unnamed protein product, partial [Ectocarpus sp. 8 AP-2014]
PNPGPQSLLTQALYPPDGNCYAYVGHASLQNMGGACFFHRCCARAASSWVATTPPHSGHKRSLLQPLNSSSSGAAAVDAAAAAVNPITGPISIAATPVAAASATTGNDAPATATTFMPVIEAATATAVVIAVNLLPTASASPISRMTPDFSPTPAGGRLPPLPSLPLE